MRVGVAALLLAVASGAGEKKPVLGGYDVVNYYTNKTALLGVWCHCVSVL